jgi:ribosomal protein L24E
MKAIVVLSFLAVLAAKDVMAGTNVDLGLKYLSDKLQNPATGNLGGAAFAVDERGDFYVTGEMHDQSRFGDTIVECAGTNSQPFQCRDLYVSKYDRSRKLVWLKHAPNAGGTAVAAHGTNWVVVAGKIWGDTRIADTEIRHAGKDRSAFLTRLDIDGKAEWVRAFDGTAASEIYGVALDAGGNMLVTGEMNGPLDFGGTTLAPRGKRDGFLAKYTADGKLIWVQQHGDALAQPRGVALDAHGNGYVTGRCWDSFAGVKIRPGSAMYLIKYAPDGKVLWATHADSDVEVTRRRAPEGIEGSNVVVDREGNPHVVGLMGGTRLFGTVTVTNESKYYAPIFLAKYAANGALEWVRQYRSGDGNFGGAVSLASAMPLPRGKARSGPTTGNAAPSAKTVSMEAAAAAATVAPTVPLIASTESGTRSAQPLRIFKADTNIVLVWPANSKDFILEGTETLMPLPIWTTISAPRTQEDAFVTVTLPAEGAAKFYRLRTP